MNVTFVFCNDEESPTVFPLGIGILSKMLKGEGHVVNSIYVPVGTNGEIDYTGILLKINEFNSEMICYSSNSPSFKYIVKIASYIRSVKDIVSICGGIHPTLYPEETLNAKGIDFICVGEGERNLKEFVKNVENLGSVIDIPGIWYLNSNGIIQKNNLYPLQDLNKSYEIDYEAFGLKFITNLLDESDNWLRYITSRGCPYSCSYCHNILIREILMKEIGVNNVDLNYVRFKDTKSCISEIAKINKKYGVKVINFMDDLFCLHKTRVMDFCDKFKTRFGNNVGYSIQTHLLHVDNEIINALYDSNCLRVVVGVESASERILKMYNRKVSLLLMSKNLKMIVKAKYPLGTWSLNMIGNPTETQKEMEATLKFNTNHKVDVCKFNFMSPYKDSGIYNCCIEHDLLIEDCDSQNFQTRQISMIKHNEKEMAFLEKFWDVGHWYMNIHSPINLEKVFNPLIGEIEEIGYDDWERKKHIYLKKGEKIIEDLKDKGSNFYEFKFEGKTSGKVIGLHQR